MGNTCAPLLFDHSKGMLYCMINDSRLYLDTGSNRALMPSSHCLGCDASGIVNVELSDDNEKVVDFGTDTVTLESNCSKVDVFGYPKVCFTIVTTSTGGIPWLLGLGSNSQVGDDGSILHNKQSQSVHLHRIYCTEVPQWKHKLVGKYQDIIFAFDTGCTDT